MKGRTHGRLAPLFSAVLVALVAASGALAAETKAKPKPKLKAKLTANKTYGLQIARHLDMAVAIDAQSRTLEAQHRAVSARYATANSITPGSPYVSGLHYKNVAGNLRDFNDTEVEAGLPLWLPGQRDAFEATVTTGVDELEQQLALRRLEVASQLRDAWWNAQRAVREVALARNRVATSKDLGHDMLRRVELGDAAQGDALLAKNETLAAETELARMEGLMQIARVAYMSLTGGAPPEGALESVRPPSEVEEHPALRTPRAALRRAEAQLRLVDASPIENPDVAVYGRHEHNNQYSTDTSQPITNQRTDATTVGLRIRIPLPTAGRNEPRIAEAQAGMDRAVAEYERAKRTVLADIDAARAGLSASQRAAGLANSRLSIANDQFQLARKSYSLGEINAFDLYRVRQLQIEAQRAQVSAAIDLGVAQSRLNQAYGYAPTP